MKSISQLNRSPLLYRQQQDLRQLIMHRIPTYIEILDKNIQGKLTAADPHDTKDEKGNYKPLNKRRKMIVELSASKLKSIEILFSKALPSLQQAEWTSGSPLEDLSDEELMARLKLMLGQRPDLAEKLFNESTVAIDAVAEVEKDGAKAN